MKSSEYWPVTLRLQAPFGLLRLRPLYPKDEAAWKRLRAANKQWLQPWEATSPVPLAKPTLSYKEYLQASNEQAKLGALLPWAIELDGQIVGQVTVASITYGSLYSASIGYFISEHAAGRGVMPTAVAMAIDYIFTYRQIHRVEINIRPENARSLRVVEKLGLRDEGMRKGYLHINGEWADHRAFALTREECPNGLLQRLATTWPIADDAKDPSHTRKSAPTLAAFRPWGSSARYRRTRGPRS